MTAMIVLNIIISTWLIWSLLKIDELRVDSNIKRKTIKSLRNHGSSNKRTIEDLRRCVKELRVIDKKSAKSMMAPYLKKDGQRVATYKSISKIIYGNGVTLYKRLSLNVLTHGEFDKIMSLLRRNYSSGYMLR